MIEGIDMLNKKLPYLTFEKHGQQLLHSEGPATVIAISMMWHRSVTQSKTIFNYSRLYSIISDVLRSSCKHASAFSPSDFLTWNEFPLISAHGIVSNCSNNIRDLWLLSTV